MLSNRYSACTFSDAPADGARTSSSIRPVSGGRRVRLGASIAPAFLAPLRLMPLSGAPVSDLFPERTASSDVANISPVFSTNVDHCGRTSIPVRRLYFRQPQTLARPAHPR
jgi:hypothetical protein